MSIQHRKIRNTMFMSNLTDHEYLEMIRFLVEYTCDVDAGPDAEWFLKKLCYGRAHLARQIWQCMIKFRYD